MSQCWELNPRPLPYQGNALPLSYTGLKIFFLFTKAIKNLLPQQEYQSGRPGSNWRHSAWKADALPTELLPLLKRNTMVSQAFNFKKPQSQYGNSSNCRHSRVKKVCGESRIRTCEDVVSRFTVCPRWPLEYLPYFLL